MLAPDQNFSLPHGHNVLRLAEWRHIERLGAVPEYHHGAHVGDFVSAEGEQRHQRAIKLLHGADENEGRSLTPGETGNSLTPGRAEMARA